MYAHIILSRVVSSTDRIYSYTIPAALKEKVQVGKQVLVPFGTKKRVGYVVGISDKLPKGVKGVKELAEVRGDLPLFSAEEVETAKWLSKYYVSFFGSALRLMLPPGMAEYERVGGKKRIRLEEAQAPLQAGQAPAKAKAKGRPKEKEKDEDLTEGQRKAVDIVTEKISANDSSTILLHGPAGSGKTRVYIELIKYLMSSGKGAIVLFPEIDADHRAVNRIKEAFPAECAVIHSMMPDKERLLQWERIYTGEARVVLGTRTALFSPVKELGLIIIDQEEEFTYKQEQSPKYHARDAAKHICGIKRIPLLLGSGCPSMEVYHETLEGASVRIEMQAPDSKIPEIELVDMNTAEKEGAGIFSRRLLDSLGDTLDRGGKALLFVNRRGYSPFLACMMCGTTVECPECSVSLAYHSHDKSLHCGKCGKKYPAPVTCPNCMSSLIRFAGTGTQRIESEMAKYFPGVRTIRLDRDSMTKRENLSASVGMFAGGGADILVGTQLSLKALGQAEIDLLGVVSADTALNIPDFRSAEMTFRMLCDVFGVSRRINVMRKAVVQTYNPGHYAVKSAVELDYKSFYEREAETREKSGYPPFGRLISVRLSGGDAEAIKQASGALAERIRANAPALEVLGPAQAGASKIRGRSIWQILIKGNDLDIIKPELRQAGSACSKKNIRVSIDVDPINIY